MKERKKYTPGFIVLDGVGIMETECLDRCKSVVERMQVSRCVLK